MELISREEALNRIRQIESTLADNSPSERPWCEISNWIYLAIANIKTEESRPKGKWIIKRDCEEVIVTCSNCGAKDYIPTTIDGRFYFNRNYCWDCGADMRGEE